MDFLELARQRRSCRKYSSRDLSHQDIEKCLEAVKLAPSACNSQPWHFIVVEDKELKNKVARAAFAGIYSMNSFASAAPVLVIVVRENSKYIAKLGGFLRGTQYSLIDLGIACEHFILQAAQQGLGTCWIGFFDEKQVKKVLKISRNKKVDIIISVGHPAGGLSLGQKKTKPNSEICEFR
tara:strand:+ start:12 stop:551 length:540 start_codon:yes stop_codon:yes gene_type:complete